MRPVFLSPGKLRNLPQIAWGNPDRPIFLTRHAKDRMSERDIVRQDVDRALQGGCLAGEPEAANEGEWKCKIVLAIKGRSRDVGVVVILRPDGRLVVKTVEWEDQK